MKKITRTRLRAFLEKHATDARVLDVGAGGTDYPSIFPNRVTVDIDPARHPDIVADAEHLPFEDSSFEVVLCTEVFEHLKHPEQVVREFRRVLAPGGTLLLTTRFIFPVHDAPHDYFRFTAYGLRFLFEGWNITEIHNETDVFATIAVLLQRAIFQTDVRGGKFTKAFLYLFMRLFLILSPLLRETYGDIQRSRKESSFCTSGLYLVATNAKK